MFYKHWKKIALALASFFWAGCGDNGSSDEVSMFAPEYGVQVMPSDSIGGAVCLYGVEAPVYVEVNNLCYNDTAVNESGRVFKIIDCIDGNKYLRNPGDAGSEGVELPEGIQVFAPKAGSEKAPNCTSDQDICIERDPSKPIEQDSLAGCHPIINCPAKPDDTTFIKVE